MLLGGANRGVRRVLRVGDVPILFRYRRDDAIQAGRYTPVSVGVDMS
jgi:hypothetical protein